jgi:hypothetical protein
MRCCTWNQEPSSTWQESHSCITNWKQGSMPPSNLFSTVAGVSLRLVPIIPIKGVAASLLYLQSFTENIFFLSWVMYSVFISVFCKCLLKQRGRKCVPIFLNSYLILNTAVSKVLVRCFQFLGPHTTVKSNNWIENLSPTLNSTVRRTALATTYWKLMIIQTSIFCWLWRYLELLIFTVS